MPAPASPAEFSFLWLKMTVTIFLKKEGGKEAMTMKKVEVIFSLLVLVVHLVLIALEPITKSSSSVFI